MSLEKDTSLQATAALEKELLALNQRMAQRKRKRNEKKTPQSRPGDYLYRSDPLFDVVSELFPEVKRLRVSETECFPVIEWNFSDEEASSSSMSTCTAFEDFQVVGARIGRDRSVNVDEEKKQHHMVRSPAVVSHLALKRHESRMLLLPKPSLLSLSFSQVRSMYGSHSATS
jgi:hypothetical protein